MKRKLWILIGMIMIFTVLFSLPTYAECDECMFTFEAYDWDSHCMKKCTCSWSECIYCGGYDYLEEFCDAEHDLCLTCGECLACSKCVCTTEEPDTDVTPDPIDYMSLYELWHAIATHWFDGVACTQAVDLFATIATSWTLIGFAMIPLRFIRGGRRS